MQISTRTTSFQAPTLAPQPLPSPEPTPVPTAPSFAALLQRTQPVCHAPQPVVTDPIDSAASTAAARAERNDNGEAEADAEPAAQTQAPARPRLAPRAPPRPAGKPVAQPAPVDEAEAARARAADAGDKTAKDLATGTPGPTALPQPVPLSPDGTGGRVGLPVGAPDAGDASGPQALPAPSGAPGGPVRGQPRDMPQGVTGLAALPPGTEPPAAAALAVEVEQGEQGKAPPGALAAGPTAPFATLLAAAGTPAQGSDAAPPPTATLATPTAAPEFAQALGVQVSVFARDGVQQAELHLNPAETGPVSVQIVLDGTQAHVEFGADLAATRQAIEAGLPELAAALRDAGFTLSGGGVSQHARGEAGSDEASRRPGATSRRSGEPMAVAAPAQPLRTRVAAGGIDLYA